MTYSSEEALGKLKEISEKIELERNQSVSAEIEDSSDSGYKSYDTEPVEDVHSEQVEEQVEDQDDMSLSIRISDETILHDAPTSPVVEDLPDLEQVLETDSISSFNDVNTDRELLSTIHQLSDCFIRSSSPSYFDQSSSLSPLVFMDRTGRVLATSNTSNTCSTSNNIIRVVESKLFSNDSTPSSPVLQRYPSTSVYRSQDSVSSSTVSDWIRIKEISRHLEKL